jgi:DNA-binding SARP family transcriptional activator/uncharacterized protein HemY
MWFGLLGPLQVRLDGRDVRVPGVKQRVLLAALLLKPGQAVSAARLSELLWDGLAPNHPTVTLRSYVKRLRQALGPAHRTLIITTSSGYKIDLAADEFDIAQFDDQLQAGVAAAKSGDWQQAADLLDGAVALWRGSPLADIPCQALQLAEVPRLEEQRLQAIQWQIEARLQLGQHDLVSPQLQSLTAEHTLRESFHGQLMVALYRSGRQADALRAYRKARDILVSELGLEPGPELQLLQQRILVGDRELLGAARQAPPQGAGPGRHLPRQLPAPVAGFTGRDTELTALAGLLVSTPRAAARPTVLVTAIGGTAGVGKTALAVQCAHQVAGSFPDGQLYVNLRGYDPGQPMTAADALARFLRDLGVPGPDMPAEEEERAARFRSLLAGRRMLVVLDNAGDADQVRPLLPGTPGCAALVTSRDALAGLVARDGARRLDLDLLPLADAVSLLRALIGGRVGAEPDAAAALAACCGRLPLALRVAAELAAARTAASLASLAGELADQQRRLDLLEAGGDPRTAVRAVFSWSIRHLDPGTARAFRLLGLHPGPDLDPYAAAALTGTSLKQASLLLDHLVRAHLIQPAGPGRHAMHDLLRDYARELAHEEDGDDEQQAAVTGLLDYYLHAAAAAMDTLYPAEQGRRPRVPAAAAVTPELAEPGRARSWLAAELACLVAVAGHAADHGWPAHAIQLSVTLHRYLDTGGHFPEAVTIHGHAHSAAQRPGDLDADAGALSMLGSTEVRQGHYELAACHLDQALALRRQTGDRVGEARVHGNLGFLAFRQGRAEQAAGHHQLALSLHRETGNRMSEGIALSNLGAAEVRLGRLEQAAGHFREALALSRDTGDQDGQAYALLSLGDVSQRQGRYEQAARHLQRCLAMCRDQGDRVGEAYALTSLGELDLRQGRSQHAAAHLHQALDLARDTGERFTETEALNLLGELSLTTGDPGQAIVHHAGALELADHSGDMYWQARAHEGLARAQHAAQNLEQARHHWQQALILYTEMGAPEADQVRGQLTSGQSE